MQKVLVTGATGFLGNYVINDLLRRGIHVITSSTSNSSANRQKWFLQTEHRPLDMNLLSSKENYYLFFNKPDILIHLAWEGLPNYKDDLHFTKVLPKQKMFLSNIIENGLKNVNITGTCFEYGMCEGELHENMEPRPANPYAIAKNALRSYTQELASKFHIYYKWIRLFYMFGEGQHPQSLFSQLKQAVDEGADIFNMSGGEQMRDFLPVEKVAEYIVDISLQSHTTGIINCCSGVPQTVKSFVVDYLRQMKSSIKLNLGYYPYPNYEPMHFWGNSTKLKKILNE